MTKTISLLNEAMCYEEYSSILYLHLSAITETDKLKGFSSWLRQGANEEQKHRCKVFDFIVINGEQPSFTPLFSFKKIDFDAESLADVFKKAYDHEKSVTEKYIAIAAQADSDHDLPASHFAVEMLQEQLEEEKKVQDLYYKILKAEDCYSAILALDNNLSS